MTTPLSSGRALGVVACLLCCRAAPNPAAASVHARVAAERTQAPVARAQPAAPLPAPPPSSQGNGPSAISEAPVPIDDVGTTLALPASRSTSLGSPGAGTLLGSVALPLHGPGFHFNALRPAQARYGTVELVQAIIRAAAVVDAELPGSELTVNDLSLQAGGRIKQHGSHQSGRDADILFFVLDGAGIPVPAVGVPFDPKGTGVDFKDLAIEADDQPLQLDRPRSWRFVQALLEIAGDRVQRIFLVEHVRRLLLQEAERVSAPAQWRERFGMLTCQPEVPHDDHMHVRLFCSPEDLQAGCLDTPPIYPWHMAALQALGLGPNLERPGDRASRQGEVAERTTSIAEARERAGPMHWKVRRFLAQRDHWVKKPHPGRRYCP